MVYTLERGVESILDSNSNVRGLNSNTILELELALFGKTHSDPQMSSKIKILPNEGH